MKKLLFVCDGDHFSHSSFEFAASVNRHENIWLKGLFLPTIDYSRMPSFAYANGFEEFIPPDFYEEEEKTMDKSIMQFENLCKEHHISYSISKHTGFQSLQELLHETRFSDLLLIGSKHFFPAMDSGQPNAEMNQLLHETECPVLLIPEKFGEPKNIILAYDGESSCMAAIKQLSMVMGTYKKLPLTVVFFSPPSGGRPPYEKPLKEYIRCHYKDFTIKVADSENIKDLNTWMTGYQSPLIVTGSYSRSGVSRVFKKSFISTVIANNHFPTFLFHSKGK